MATLHRNPHARTPAHDLLPRGLQDDPIDLVTRIARELDHRHWNGDTLERISRYLKDAGFDIREPGHNEEGGT